MGFFDTKNLRSRHKVLVLLSNYLLSIQYTLLNLLSPLQYIYSHQNSIYQIMLEVVCK